MNKGDDGGFRIDWEAIYKRVNRLYNGEFKDEEDMHRRLYKELESSYRLQDLYLVNKTTILKRLKYFGIHTPHINEKGIRTAGMKVLKKLVDEGKVGGMTMEEIKEVCGFTKRQECGAYSYLKQRGVEYKRRRRKPKKGEE